jgi:F-type H+-transporting ATPase subunit alpha
MKLDYLQFLELEVFTRFGARLETSIEAKIKRGRVLREVLKQERLSPLPVEFQMAWMVAFNEGLLDAVAGGEVPAVLSGLAGWVSTSGLTLDDKPEDWKRAVETFFSLTRKEQR